MPELMSTDEDPAGQQSIQARIQQIVSQVAQDVGGNDDARVARERIEAGLAAAGIPEQPEKWVGDTAAEIAAGRGVVVDRREDGPMRAAQDRADAGDDGAAGEDLGGDDTGRAGSGEVNQKGDPEQRDKPLSR